MPHSGRPLFYVGLHQPSDGRHFARACFSINRLRQRRKPLGCAVMVDSGAFTELAQHGHYRHDVRSYADSLVRLYQSGAAHIDIAVAQDFMCEPFMLARTGLKTADHQRLTIERFDALAAEGLPFPIMPVLQGYDPAEYRAHLLAYGNRLPQGAWVGVGSVCKRNSRPEAIVAVLRTIKAERPDLRLHGFGVKLTALLHPEVCGLLHSADSLAWSYSARRQGRSANDWREAKAFADRIERATITASSCEWQLPLL